MNFLRLIRSTKQTKMYLFLVVFSTSKTRLRVRQEFSLILILSPRMEPLLCLNTSSLMMVNSSPMPSAAKEVTGSQSESEMFPLWKITQRF
jgi:hypothetical protein